ncbi:hypothetical protein P153DRAFT_364948 [Dothidotthia symphoricarpi CBS 119687]|uniref:C2H2-type domain-containing protein n=1 Tax=Dothidotthia symphoricarpi CBS 119687 TaxID=1392245 RepID=A0A6A6AKB5_9PLEO|nr:uncharacterized protein P153DRAFT_364948 [Dothidotthia symphoricarpi CBS 119687]KAF2131354.1 hypothetical protein P153DRAFT_364948 [Dothidotthia symphoricarpi CBS 119687]
MDGQDASGRRVSLLNDNPQAPPLIRLPSISPSLRSRTSSYTSSRVGSPPTPYLVRSNSSDSVESMQTPSPITPDFNFDSHGLESPVFAQAGFFSQQKDFASAYPPVPQPSGPLPYHPTGASQAAVYFQPQQQTIEPRVAPPSASSNARPKKNSYPCPLAQQYNCSDYFTTSGHAARHAKKHTGKKDAFCPECNKAFTRKDNMEQHRRTHQSGRNATKGSDNGVKKPKHQAKRPRPSPIQSSIPSMSSLALVDPSLPVSPVEQSFIAPAVQPMDTYMEFTQRSPYPDPTAFSMNGYNIGSFNNGLDALAIAASGEKRKFES